ncbi:hypothetical protein [Massilia sp. Leaf139]|uniref:hypothetical protein n=1 Tax=Massilia sp. Leaf139 TaxID=1736272 RepID=UPI000AEABFB9|nr:hypothetical protein [Massilia sp. Leaf139]
MEGGVFLGLQLPVMLAFFALLAGLILLGRQLHQLRRPAVVRRGAHPPPGPHFKSERASSHPDQG